MSMVMSCGYDQKRFLSKIQETEMVARFTLRDRVRSSVIQGVLRVESLLLLRIDWSQLRRCLKESMWSNEILQIS